jgi:hypothetical protein
VPCLIINAKNVPWTRRTWMDPEISISGHVPLIVSDSLHRDLRIDTIRSCSDVKSSRGDPRLGGGRPDADSSTSHTRNILFHQIISH